ncbi:hypothetical protein AX14_012809, partial [Amanita brunnescens Koide BX004]
MAFSIVDIWHNLIDLFGNYPALDVMTWSYRVQLTISVIIVLSVQRHPVHLAGLETQPGSKPLLAMDPGYHFRYRICLWNHPHRYDESHSSVLSSLPHSLVGLSYFYNGFIQRYYARCWDLPFALPRNNNVCRLVSRTKSMVWTIIRYVIISGALTSACSFVGVTTFFVMPNNFVFIGITFVLTKLYINSYFAMLNARKSIRGKGHDAMQEPIDLEARFSAIDFRGSVSASGGNSEEAGSRVPGTRDKGGVKVGALIVRQRSHS